MKLPFLIGEREFLLEPYTTAQEKEILLLSSFNIESFERVFEVLNFDCPGDLSDNEKKVILYQLRAISLGDEIDIKYKCDNCHQVNEPVIEANEFVETASRNDNDVLKLNKIITDDNLNSFVALSDDELDELDILDFEKLKERVKENQLKFNFNKTTKCMKCGNLKTFDMSDLKYILEIMSDDSLMTLYTSYNYLTYFGNYTKEDIDKMYPFERGIFTGLLTKTKEDLSA